MEKYRKVLVTALKDSRLTGREIANRVGVHESTISKFIDGQTDLKAANYFKILDVLPEDEAAIVRERLGISLKDKPQRNLVELIEIATDDELEAALLAIGKRWKQLRSASIGDTVSASTEEAKSAVAV